MYTDSIFCISMLFISSVVFQMRLCSNSIWHHQVWAEHAPQRDTEYQIVNKITLIVRSLSALYNSTKIMCTLCFYLLKMSWLALLPVYPAMIDKCTLAFLVLRSSWLCKDQLVVICWGQGNTFLLTDVFSQIWNFKYNKPSSQNYFEYIA